MIADLDKLHQTFSGCDSEEQSKPAKVIRSYTKPEVEKLTKLDGRIMKPDTIKYPGCAMLKYQIGKVLPCRGRCGEAQCDHQDGFKLVAFGETWGEAVAMWRSR